MTQIEIFTEYNNPKDLADSVNAWLAKEQGRITILSQQLSTVFTKNGTAYLVLSLLYDKNEYRHE